MPDQNSGQPPAGNTAEGWRQQIIDARREQILDATAVVFAKKGFHRATIRDIARQAGIADGTIYNYFSGKQDLLVGLIDKLALAPLREIFAKHQADRPQELLRLVIGNRIQFVRAHRDILVSVYPEVIANPELRQYVIKQQILPFTETLQAYIRSAIEAGLVNAVNPVLFTQMVFSTLLNLALIDMSDEVDTFAGLSDEQLADQMTEILYHGLALGTEAG